MNIPEPSADEKSQQLHAFYDKWAPEKKSQIPMLSTQNTVSWNELVRALQSKYGESPAQVYAQVRESNYSRTAMDAPPLPYGSPVKNYTPATPPPHYEQPVPLTDLNRSLAMKPASEPDKVAPSVQPPPADGPPDGGCKAWSVVMGSLLVCLVVVHNSVYHFAYYCSDRFIPVCLVICTRLAFGSNLSKSFLVWEKAPWQ